MAMPQVGTVDPRRLRMVLTIVEAGGFTAAQSELNLSMSTISTHFADPETRLGLRLVSRVSWGFRDMQGVRDHDAQGDGGAVALPDPASTRRRMPYHREEQTWSRPA